MEFFVYSRGAIERLPPHDVPHVIISITTTSVDQARLRPGGACNGVLRLSFLDVDTPPADDPGGIFGTHQAKAIWDFVEAHQAEITRVVLHCDAGISRSPAVAAALSVCLGDGDEELFRRYRPNMLVYRTPADEWHSRHAVR